MTSAQDRKAPRDLPEFDVWPTSEGWAGRHKATRREISGETWAALEIQAMVVRIASGWGWS